MKIIYIRHGDKLYGNHERTMYSHDSPLSEKGKAQIAHLAKRLKEEGRPDLVLVSPYLRTMETAAIFKENGCFEDEVKIDVHVAEFLGNQKYTNILNDTRKYNPPTHRETLDELRDRANLHIEELEAYKQRGIKEIWVISHGFTIYTIVKEILRIDRPEFNLHMGEHLKIIF